MCQAVLPGRTSLSQKDVKQALVATHARVNQLVQQSPDESLGNQQLLAKYQQLLVDTQRLTVENQESLARKQKLLAEGQKWLAEQDRLCKRERASDIKFV